MSNMRLLIVEDERIIRETLQQVLEAEGHKVDVAADKREGLTCIENRTYHAAIVDIMLAGSDVLHDRGGFDVIRRIVDLDEGTQVLICSASDDIDVALKAGFTFKVFGYIKKIELDSIEAVTSKVEAALNCCKLRLYGPKDSLVEYLAHPMSVDMWPHKVIEHIGAGGHPVFREYLDRVFNKILPILLPKGQSSLFSFDAGEKTLTGLCWSKALGRPVVAYLSPSQPTDLAPRAVETLGSIVADVTVKGLRGRVWVHEDTSRSLFRDRLWEF